MLADMVDDMLLRQFLARTARKSIREKSTQLKAFGEKLQEGRKTLAGWYRGNRADGCASAEAWTSSMQLTGYVKSNTAEEQLKAYFAQKTGPLRPRRSEGAAHCPPGGQEHAARLNARAAKERLEAIRARSLQGKVDFAAAAKKFSHCPAAPAGGDIGYIFRKGGLVDESFAKAAVSR